jgi:hypothetical protein
VIKVIQILFSPLHRRMSSYVCDVKCLD